MSEQLTICDILLPSIQNQTGKLSQQMESYHSWLWQNPMTQRSSRMHHGLFYISHNQVGMLCSAAATFTLYYIVIYCVIFFYSRILHKPLMSSRCHTCASTIAAVFRFRGSILQLLCSLQHCCFPGAPLQIAQHWRSFFVKVSSDSHVFLSAKGKLQFLTDVQGKSSVILT